MLGKGALLGYLGFCQSCCLANTFVQDASPPNLCYSSDPGGANLYLIDDRWPIPKNSYLPLQLSLTSNDCTHENFNILATLPDNISDVKRYGRLCNENGQSKASDIYNQGRKSPEIRMIRNTQQSGQTLGNISD